jgi:hypothetical protein
MNFQEFGLQYVKKFFGQSGLEGKQDSHQWLDTIQTSDTWEDHAEAAILKDWANEILSAQGDNDLMLWELAGTSIVVVQEDQGDLREVHRLLASSLRMNAAFIPSNEIKQILPDLRTVLDPIAPALVLLEEGDWCNYYSAGRPHLFSESSSNNEQSGPVKSDLESLSEELKNFNAERPVLFLLGLKNLGNISDILCQRGAFDRFIVIGNKPKEKLGKQFCHAIGMDHIGSSITENIGKLGMLIQSEFKTSEQRELAAFQLTRLARKLNRKLEFSDVVDIVLRGFVEVGSEVDRQLKDINRRKTACHEAGHAAIAILESGGKNIPEYASIIPSKNFAGVVLESLDFIAKQNEFTFSDLLLKIRISLAGRAAEEFFFSSADVSSGADSDLAYATNVSFHFFAFSGFHRNMDQSHFSGKNLAVISYDKLDSIQRDRINSEVRFFLAEQYEQVLGTLKAHSVFVESIADRLMWDPIVDQYEMIDICKQSGIYTDLTISNS